VKQLISDGTPDADKYLMMYTSFINGYRVGQYSDNMLLLLNSGQATALKKTDSSLRSIGKCGFHRKTLLRVSIMLARDQILAAADKLNTFLAKRGTENLIWLAKMALETKTEKHLLFTDLKNAYQTVHRAEAVQKLLSKLADGYDAFFSAYGQQADMWYFGMEKGAGAIISMQGGTQGCVGGGIIHFYRTYDFCVDLQNLISEVYDDGDILRWHADDGIGIVSMEAAMTVLDTYLPLYRG
jgi:hypothetical protein